MNFRRLAPEQIRLDPRNPRLPEELQDQPQSILLRYLFENAVLDELGRSYLENGFFDHEPLIVVEDDGHVAVEGNRRLAALKVLRGDAPASEAGLRFDFEEEVTAEDHRKLDQIPVYLIESRDAVRKYLGYRHIGGIKTWSAEAKARYLAAEVDNEGDNEAAFREVAQRVGSNTQGVRNAYMAIATLKTARDEMHLKVEPILHRRFGVWTRCMNSPQLRSYVGIGDPRTLPEVKAELRHLKRTEMEEVLGDLSPRPGRKKPLLADSRDVTVYAQALQLAEARAALREYDDLSLAREIVEEAGLPERVASLANGLESIVSQVSKSRALPHELIEAVDRLEPLVGSLRALTLAKIVPTSTS